MRPYQHDLRRGKTNPSVSPTQRLAKTGMSSRTCTRWRRARRGAALTIVGAAACIAGGHVTPGPAPAPLLGRWMFEFEIMGGLFRTPVELRADTAGTLRASSLGPPLVQFTAAHATNDDLHLEGTSRYGAIHVGGKLVADSFDGRWRIKILRGRVTAHRARSAPSTAAERLAAFDALRDTLARRYYDPTMGGVNWDSLASAYRLRVAATRSDAAWLELARDLISHLHSSHLDVSAITLEEALPSRGGGARTDESKIITWRALNDSVGYLRIAQFDEGRAAVARLDTAFDALKTYPSLVVDVRRNPGGTLAVAMRLGDYLLPTLTPVGTFRTRRAPPAPAVYDGYDVSEFVRLLRDAGAVTIKSGGRAPRRWPPNRVALLIDHGCGSTTEAFAAVLQELKLATLVGERTAGAMLSSIEVSLPNGWILRFPEADFFTPAGRRVEGNGVSPDIPASKHWYHDGQLAAAVMAVSGKR